jgi:DNA polymerase-3 subunit delta'
MSRQDIPFYISSLLVAFQQVIGQDVVKRQLVEWVQSRRLGHAILFLGKEGTGALPLANAFVQYIVCENRNGSRRESPFSLFAEEPKETGPALMDACGICPACIKSFQMVHPDIHFSYPVIPNKPGDKPISTDYIASWRTFLTENPYGNVYDWLQFIGAENKQGNITANECADIIHKLYLKSFESEYKILLMWMPEYLGNEGNKLLKLLEEPPPNTLFLLVAESESLILPTILSRTQLIKIPSLSSQEIEEALIRQQQLDPRQAKQIASISDGNYREARQILQHAEENWQDILREWLNAILRTGPAAQIKWIDEMSRLGREKQKQFLRYFNQLLDQAIRLTVMGAPALNIPASEKDFAERLNKIADISQQQAIVEELDRASYYIERNAHSKLLFHALTIKLYHILSDRTLAITR